MPTALSADTLPRTSRALAAGSDQLVDLAHTAASIVRSRTLDRVDRARRSERCRQSIGGKASGLRTVDDAARAAHSRPAVRRNRSQTARMPRRPKLRPLEFRFGRTHGCARRYAGNIGDRHQEQPLSIETDDLGFDASAFALLHDTDAADRKLEPGRFHHQTRHARELAARVERARRAACARAVAQEFRATIAEVMGLEPVIVRRACDNRRQREATLLDVA